eukprot:8086031-Pyramimonas_sp.AAC.1
MVPPPEPSVPHVARSHFLQYRPRNSPSGSRRTQRAQRVPSRERVATESSTASRSQASASSGTAMPCC